MHQLFYKHLLKIFFCISIFCTASYVFHWQSWACLRQLQLQQLSENKSEWSPRDEFFFFSKAFATVFYCVLLDRTTPLKLIVYIGRWVSCRKVQAQGAAVKGVTPGWWLGISGAHQGSALRQILYSVAVSNLDRGVEYTLSKFAKDTKLGDADSLAYREAFTETSQ